MQDPATSLGSFATAWESYGSYVQLLLGLLFGWLLLNWLSNIAARMESLSITVGDLRKDLDELKDEVKAQVSREG